MIARYDTVAPIDLVDYMQSTKFCGSETATPFAHSIGEGMWEYFEKKPVLQQSMMDYMEGRRKGCPRWVNVFPASDHLGPLSSDAVAVRIVDIGGNVGHDLKVFRETYPDLKGRCVVQDLQPVIERASPVEGVEFQAHSFFTPQPIIGISSFPGIFSICIF